MKDIRGCYTYAFRRYATLMNEGGPDCLTGTETLPAQKILEGLQPLGSYTSLSTGQMRRTSTQNHERNRTQGPSIDGTSFFKLLFAGLINWVLASSGFAGKLLILLAKLKFSRLCMCWVSRFGSDTLKECGPLCAVFFFVGMRGVLSGQLSTCLTRTNAVPQSRIPTIATPSPGTPVTRWEAKKSRRSRWLYLTNNRASNKKLKLPKPQSRTKGPKRRRNRRRRRLRRFRSLRRIRYF